MNDMDDKLLNNNPLSQVNKIHIQEYVLFDMDIQLDHLQLIEKRNHNPLFKFKFFSTFNPPCIYS
jgi:hypothetical protein